MTAPRERRTPPRVLVTADAEAPARSLIDHILKPGGIHAWGTEGTAPPADILLVDITQLRGDPLAGLRPRRGARGGGPAGVLAAPLPRPPARHPAGRHPPVARRPAGGPAPQARGRG